MSEQPKRRIALRVGLATIAVVVAAGAAAWFSADSLVEAGIERGGGSALGVPVAVGSTDVGLLRERLEVADLRVANPEGFADEDFLRIGRAEASVALPALATGRAHLHELRLSGIDLHLERTASNSNYGTILDHMGEGDGSQGDEGETRLSIDRLVLEDIRVESRVPLVPTPPVEIERISVADVSGEMSTAELSAVVVRVLLEEAATEAIDLPVDVIESLGEDIGDLVVGGVKRLGG